MNFFPPANVVAKISSNLGNQGCPQKKKVEWCFYKIYQINKTTRWEVVKNSASPNLDFCVVFPIFIPVSKSKS